MQPETDHKARSQGGRPSREEAALRDERILEVALTLFMANGFAATSIEAVARGAGVAKRTLYARYPDKAALFVAVIRRQIDEWLATLRELGGADADVAALLYSLGISMFEVTTSPQAVALIRIIRAEGVRFPDMAEALHEMCLQHIWGMIAGILRREAERGRLRIEDPMFAACQFHQLVVGEPLDRLLSGNPHPLTAEQGADWVRRSVALFLHGVS